MIAQIVFCSLLFVLFANAFKLNAASYNALDPIHRTSLSEVKNDISSQIHSASQPARWAMLNEVGYRTLDDLANNKTIALRSEMIFNDDEDDKDDEDGKDDEDDKAEEDDEETEDDDDHEQYPTTDPEDDDDCIDYEDEVKDEEAEDDKEEEDAEDDKEEEEAEDDKEEEDNEADEDDDDSTHNEEELRFSSKDPSIEIRQYNEVMYDDTDDKHDADEEDEEDNLFTRPFNKVHSFLVGLATFGEKVFHGIIEGLNYMRKT